MDRLSRETAPGVHDPEPTATAAAREGKAKLRIVDGGTARHAAAACDWSALMGQAQDGDDKAYARLLNEITPYLRSLAARRLTGRAAIEDAVQDVLLTIHALRHTYDPNRPFGPWLVTIATRRIIDRFRREARRTARETELRSTVLRSTDETFPAPQAKMYEQAAEVRALWAAVERLPPSQREAIRLLKLQEMSLKDASRASGMSIGALKVATHRAVKNLRKIFSGRDDPT